MRDAGPEASRAPALDALRAGAAALVLLSHARSLVLRDASPGLSWPVAAFFGLSGFGHQAVIVFFVLSGLVVSGSMLRLAAAGRWSLGTFATARLVRLWIVLVPCLAGGALLDRLGLGLGAQTYGIPAIGHAAGAIELGLGTALGNLLFLQTIAVPVLGSNGPLWSLANEAWYYAVAALGFAAWQARHRPGPALGLAAAALMVLVLLPVPVVELAPVWGCGAAVALLRHRAPRVAAALRRPAGLVGALGLGVVLSTSRLHWGPGPLAADLVLGAAVAAVLVALPEPRGGTPGRGAALARRLADMSYSLYLSHVPVLALVAAVAVGPQRLPAGPWAFLLLGLALGLAGGSGWVVWWACERHTDRLRAWLARRPRWRPASVRNPREALP